MVQFRKKTGSHLFAFFLFFCGPVLIPAVHLTRWVSIFTTEELKKGGKEDRYSRRVRTEEVCMHCTVD